MAVSVLEAGRDVVRLAREEHLLFKSAGVAFYALLSLLPLLTIALVVLSVFGATDILVSALRSTLSQSAGEVLTRALSGARGRTAAGVVSLTFALWSGMKVFRGLSVAFDELYDASEEHSLLTHAWKSLLVLGLLFGAVALLSTAGVALTYVRFEVPSPRALGSLLGVLVLSVGFLPLYYVLPPVSVSVRHAVPGAVLAAVGWVLVQVTFLYYTGAASRYAAYGFLGAVLLFVTALYAGAILLLVGAVVNVVLDVGASGVRSVSEPDETGTGWF